MHTLQSFVGFVVFLVVVLVQPHPSVLLPNLANSPSRKVSVILFPSENSTHLLHTCWEILAGEEGGRNGVALWSSNDWSCVPSQLCQENTSRQSSWWLRQMVRLPPHSTNCKRRGTMCKAWTGMGSSPGPCWRPSTVHISASFWWGTLINNYCREGVRGF